MLFFTPIVAAGRDLVSLMAQMMREHTEEMQQSVEAMCTMHLKQEEDVIK